MEAVSPVSLKDAADGVPTCAKFEQPAPAQRSTRYPVTPTLSVAAVQVRLICDSLITVGAGVPGAVGAWVSGAARVIEPPVVSAPTGTAPDVVPCEFTSCSATVVLGVEAESVNVTTATTPLFISFEFTPHSRHRTDPAAVLQDADLPAAVAEAPATAEAAVMSVAG